MLKSMFSKFKAADTATQNQAETAAAESISTAERAASLMAQLAAAKDAAVKFSPGWRLLCAQYDQASIAVQRHQIEADRKRVASAMQRDRAVVDKALTDAQDMRATALDNLQSAQTRYQTISARLRPLEDDLKNAQRKAEENAVAVQIELDSVIATGDDAAAMVAAEKLFQAQNDNKTGAILNGPLGLRIEAIRRELAAVADMVTVQEKAVEQATHASLMAQAQLAMVEYDKQAQALLDAHVAQRIAINACGDSREVFWTNSVIQFGAQVSSAERILFGTTALDAYANRYLPAYAVQNIVDALTAPPDLAVLAAKVEDLPSETSEPAAP